MKLKDIVFIKLLNFYFHYSFFLTLIFSMFSFYTFSQNTSVSISTTGNKANPNAMLDIDVSGMNPKAGMLVPRMSTIERNAITLPIPESLLMYNTDTHCFESYYNPGWVAFGCLGECQLPAPPVAGTNIPSPTQIVWSWSRVSGPTSYKWGTTSDYSLASDNGASIAFTQTGLNSSTSYSLYVWAYNSCGNSSVTILPLTKTCDSIAGTACSNGSWQSLAGCDDNYGCASFWGVYYGNPQGDCNGAHSSSFVESKVLDCTYVGFAYYDPFHYPQPPTGACFNSSKAGYSIPNTYTKVIPGTGCTHYKYVTVPGTYQCDGTCLANP